MKTCGYCGRTYDDSEQKCPGCGSTLLKHSHVTDSAAADYDRIKREIEKKRKQKSKILAGIAAAVVLLIIIIVVSTIARGPQRRIDSNARDMYESALRDYNAGNYDSALSTLGAIDTSWSDYSKANTLKQKAVSGMLRERASSYMASGDYAGIIRLVNTNVDNINSDSEIKSIYDTAVAAYRDQVISDAKSEFSNKGYEAAIAVINNGLSVLNGDAILQAEKDSYLQYAPVDLTSLTPYYEGYISVFTDGATDIMGNYYSTGIRGYMDTSWDNCYNIWDIGGRYNILTATGIVFEEEKGSSCVGSYKIYGDGVLLYERNNISSQTKPYTIEVDITGVTDLKIEMYGQGNMGAYGINSALVDVRLQRTR